MNECCVAIVDNAVRKDPELAAAAAAWERLYGRPLTADDLIVFARNRGWDRG